MGLSTYKAFSLICLDIDFVNQAFIIKVMESFNLNTYPCDVSFHELPVVKVNVTDLLATIQIIALSCQ